MLDIKASNKSISPRYSALDGARGIAAFTVLIAHCMSRVHVPLGSYAETSLKAFLTLGHTAVIFFFVLSGFVLSIRFFGFKTVSFWRFQISRLARLYPCFIVTMIVAAVVRVTITTSAAYHESGIFSKDEQYPLTSIDFLRQVMLIGLTRADINLNGPVWSMIYELRSGLFIPLFCWALVRFSLLTSITACCTLIAFSSVGLWLLQMPNPPFTGEGSAVGSAFVTFHYLVAFYIGCIMSRISHSGIADFRSPVGTMAAALALLAVGTALHSDVLLSLCAACIILAIRQSQLLNAALTVAPCAFLGHISYPLYLVHFPILTGILKATDGEVSQWKFILISLVITIPAATLIYWFIEIPSIAWSRSINRQ